MIKSITLENFMSHQATRIELAPGVTVITGPNNVGKSALVEAVRSLVQNPSQKHSIRHGAKQAVVRLELDSGEIIEWVRTEKTAYYRLFRPDDGGEPVEYRKIGLTVPEDVRALLRLGLVETEADDIDIHIGNQREPIFLLNRPGSQAAGFFAASSEAEYLLHMRQALKSREDYAKSTRKVLAGEVQVLERDLLRYQPLDGIGPELDRAEETYELIGANQRSLPELAECIDTLAVKGQALNRHGRRAGLLRGLGVPPVLKDIADLIALLQHWGRISGKAGAAAARVEALGPLTAAPPLVETDSLAQLAGRLAATAGVLHGRRREKEGLAGLAEPPLIHDVLPLEAHIKDLRSREELRRGAQRRQKALVALAAPGDLAGVDDLLQVIANLARLETRQGRLEGESGALGELRVEPALAPTLDLERLIGQTEANIKETSRRQQEREALAEALDKKRTEVAALIRETGLCPLCGSPMDVAHFLEAVHG